MRILISHCTYPSQFRRLAPALASKDHQVVFLHQGREWHATEMNDVQLVQYQSVRSQNPELGHPYLRKLESAVCQGQAAYRAARHLKDQGFSPDLIISHAGYGAGLYLGDVFPNAKRIGLFEWYYNAYGSDVEFIQRGLVEPDRQLRLRTWNAQLLLELADCDAAVVPTTWQRQQFPSFVQSQFTTIHEGIDHARLSQLRQAKPQRPEWWPQGEGIQVVSYVSRGFEEYRGFPQAMQAIALLQQENPEVNACIAGHDTTCYGSGRNDGRTWKEWAQSEAGLDPNRTHWLGPLETEDYQSVLAYTDVHLYLTIPFVLSWSLLEAMAAGCPIVASTTAPVEEVIQHSEEGLLADFWSPTDIAQCLKNMIENPEQAVRMGEAAMAKARCYSAESGLDGWSQLISTLT